MPLHLVPPLYQRAQRQREAQGVARLGSHHEEVLKILLLGLLPTNIATTTCGYRERERNSQASTLHNHAGPAQRHDEPSEARHHLLLPKPELGNVLPKKSIVARACTLLIQWEGEVPVLAGTMQEGMQVRKRKHALVFVAFCPCKLRKLDRGIFFAKP